MSGLRLIASGVIAHRVRPYTRMTRKSKWSRASKRYHASQRILALELLDAFRLALDPDPHDPPVIKVPFRLGLIIEVPPTQKGVIPANVGDADNYRKAFLDAAKWGCVIKDDSTAHYRGPVDLDAEDPVRLGEVWRFQWAFFEALQR